MTTCIDEQTGIYIAYPTTDTLKSIYRPKNYKTEVNNQHTKVGIAKESFQARKTGYTSNFDNEVEFHPIAIIDRAYLEEAESKIIAAICKEFGRVGRAREWFCTSDHKRIVDIIIDSLSASGIKHELLWASRSPQPKSTDSEQPCETEAVDVKDNQEMYILFALSVAVTLFLAFVGEFLR